MGGVQLGGLGNWLGESSVNGEDLGKTSVQTSSNPFLKILTEGAVTIQTELMAYIPGQAGDLQPIKLAKKATQEECAMWAYRGGVSELDAS